MKSAISLHTIVHQVGKTIELYKKFCGKWFKFKICLMRTVVNACCLDEVPPSVEGN
jgi:hypothetical protein